jgi:hypothetical protein
MALQERFLLSTVKGLGANYLQTMSNFLRNVVNRKDFD